MLKTRYAFTLAVLACGCSSSPAETIGSTREAVVVSQGLLTVDVQNSGPAEVGQQQTFTSTITNNTTETLTNVAVAESSQNGLIDHIRSTVGTCIKGGTISGECFLGTFTPGETATITFVTIPQAPGTLEFTNTVVQNNTSDQATTTEDDIQIAASPTDVQVTGSASTGGPKPGQSFTYTFQVKNNGPNPTSGVTFTDTLPAVLPIGGATVPSEAAGACSIAGQTVTCSLGALAVGAQEDVVISTTAPTTEQTIADTGTASSDAPDSQPSNDSVTVTVQVKN